MHGWLAVLQAQVYSLMTRKPRIRCTGTLCCAEPPCGLKSHKIKSFPVGQQMHVRAQSPEPSVALAGAQRLAPTGPH